MWWYSGGYYGLSRMIYISQTAMRNRSGMNFSGATSFQITWFAAYLVVICIPDVINCMPWYHWVFIIIVYIPTVSQSVYSSNPLQFWWSIALSRNSSIKGRREIAGAWQPKRTYTCSLFSFIGASSTGNICHKKGWITGLCILCNLLGTLESILFVTQVNIGQISLKMLLFSAHA